MESFPFEVQGFFDGRYECSIFVFWKLFAKHEKNMVVIFQNVKEGFESI